MTSHPNPAAHVLFLFVLGFVILVFAVALALFKTAITGQAIYHAGNGQEVPLENMTVTFDAKPIPADAAVVAHVAGMTSQQPLRNFALREPYSIVYEDSSIPGYDEQITVPFERFGIPLPEGVHNLSISISYEDAIIDQIVVPLRISPRDDELPPQRIIAPSPAQQTQADYSPRVFFISLGIISLLVALLIVLFHMRIFNLPPDLFKTRNVVRELAGLIRQKRASGLSDEKIMQVLKEVASHDTIVTAFVALDGEEIRSYIRSHQKKGYSSAQIRIALERRHLKDVIDRIFDQLD